MMHYFILSVITALVLVIAPLIQANKPDTWKSLAPLPTGPLQEHSTVALSSTHLAILGGQIANTTTIASVNIYSIPENTWKSAAPLPIPLNHPNAAVVDGKVYVLGGLAASVPGGGVESWHAVPDSWVYDPTTDIWKSIGAMPASQARGSAAVGVYNRTIYLAGGLPSLFAPSFDIVTSFNIDTRIWTELSSDGTGRLPQPRDHAGAAVVGSKFYVVGGRNTGMENRQDTVFVLDLDQTGAENGASTWQISSAKMPTARSGIAAGVIGKKIYIFGGEGNPESGSKGVFDQTEVYDTETNSWTRLGPMKVPRHGTSAVSVGGGVFIPGGGVSKASDPTDVFDVFYP